MTHDEQLAIATPGTVFDRVLHITLLNEGGNVTAEQARAIGDYGGATNLGITEVTLRRFGIRMEPEDITADFAREFYRTRYWALRYGARSLVPFSPAVALAVFDAGVQHGTRLAIRMFQRAAGAKADGYAGAQTMAAVRQRGTGTTLVRFHSRRRRLVLRWAARDIVKRGQLMDGIIRRVDRMERTSLEWELGDAF